jgi:hypothetical protein
MNRVFVSRKIFNRKIETGNSAEKNPIQKLQGDKVSPFAK